MINKTKYFVEDDMVLSLISELLSLNDFNVEWFKMVEVSWY
jgi:hypothetical protein